MKLVRRLIAKVAPTNSTVLIVGETGTGKELVARALHDQSLRAEMPFVPINCGALPENLIESELFGHRKGAFTGAEEHRIGLFEVAHGGTLLLDEIGELPKSMQAKLLRFLESGEVRRVGDNDAFTCDVRVICATNRRLDAMVAAGEFREDLWFRVNTFEIPLPSLRERIDDIGLLARHLAVRNCAPAGCDDEIFTPEALAALEQHTWPGNVRELANVIEHALILCDGGPIRPEHLPQRFAARPSLAIDGETAGGRQSPRPGDAGHSGGAGSPLGQQAQGGRGVGHQPENALQQAEPGGSAGKIGVKYLPRKGETASGGAKRVPVDGCEERFLFFFRLPGRLRFRPFHDSHLPRQPAVILTHECPALLRPAGFARVVQNVFHDPLHVRAAIEIDFPSRSGPDRVLRPARGLRIGQHRLTTGLLQVGDHRFRPVAVLPQKQMNVVGQDGAAVAGVVSRGHQFGKRGGDGRDFVIAQFQQGVSEDPAGRFVELAHQAAGRLKMLAAVMEIAQRGQRGGADRV